MKNGQLARGESGKCSIVLIALSTGDTCQMARPSGLSRHSGWPLSGFWVAASDAHCGTGKLPLVSSVDFNSFGNSLPVII